MSFDDPKGINLSPKNVTYAVSIFALLTIFWNLFSYFKEEEFANHQNANDVVVVRKDLEAMSTKLDKLNLLVAELVFIAKGSRASSEMTLNQELSTTPLK
ncbi:MAG: hypothetical protein ACEQSB_00365 [Undibacterium sp.]